VKLLGFERRWLMEIFAALLPASDDPRFPLGASALGAERYIDDLMRSAPRDFALGLRVCTWLLQLAPLFTYGRLVRFAGLDAAARSELLERLTRSDVYLIRELPMLFKTAACLGLCGLPALQRRIGIHPVDASDPEWARTGSTGRRLPRAVEERP
jgi:hypothetical protein